MNFERSVVVGEADDSRTPNMTACNTHVKTKPGGVVVPGPLPLPPAFDFERLRHRPFAEPITHPHFGLDDAVDLEIEFWQRGLEAAWQFMIRIHPIRDFFPGEEGVASSVSKTIDNQLFIIDDSGGGSSSCKCTRCSRELQFAVNSSFIP